MPQRYTPFILSKPPSFPYTTVAILGGTGSFGQAMTAFLLEHTAATIRIYSRSELLQAQMRTHFAAHEDRIRWFLGDVRDLARLHTALVGVECVWHAAALKHIDILEYNPTEAIATNIHGTENVVSACRTMGVQRAILLSTDKACEPINIYGATKLVAEKLWTRANAYAPAGTIYNTIRYGNVSNSRGSVIPKWRQALRDHTPLLVTEYQMTRFWISLPEAVRLAFFAALHGPKGSILVPHLPAYSLKDLAQAVAAEAGVTQIEWEEIGKRSGEKVHEKMLTEDEAASTVVYAEGNAWRTSYCIPPAMPSWPVHPHESWGVEGSGLWTVETLTTPYCSDTWPWRLSVGDLRERLREEP